VCISNVQVKMVRIQWPDKNNPITHKTNVTVGMPKDSNTNSVYIRITVNQQVLSPQFQSSSLNGDRNQIYCF
jgi:hypothetical protein